MKVSNQIISVMIIALLSNPCDAAWLREKGKGQVIVNTSYYSANEFITPDGNSLKITDYDKYELNPYVEYGLLDWVTIGGSTSLQSISQSSDDNFGIGDTDIFARFKVYEDNGFVFSLSPLIKFPALADKKEVPTIASGQYHAELRANAGYGFKAFDIKHFATLSAGPRVRMGSSDNQLRFDAAYGIKPDDKWMFLLKSSGILSENLPDISARSIKTGNDHHLIKTQISGVYNLSESTSLEVGAFTDVYSRNTSDGDGILFSVWRRF